MQTNTNGDGRTGLRCMGGIHGGGDAPARKRHRGRAPGGVPKGYASVPRGGPNPLVDLRRGVR